ncbi:hypothetical protein [Campylobacter mucosalis]|nr:hypothetical protein [Campylobacter mucosalis]KEA45405.1 hypothetical protein CR66_07750 [Campylobacter mucosalis]QKF63817.1 hypothetical protein CMCT_1719 [Campylobacter mucosalis]
MKKLLLFILLVLFFVGCGRSSIPLNKGALQQRNVYDVNEILGSEYAKQNIKGFDRVRLEFGSNDQNKTIKKANIKVQKYVTTSSVEFIKDACTEAFIEIIRKYVKSAIKHKADVVNISSNWRGNKELLKDKFVCMSGPKTIGIMLTADFAEK